MANDELQLDCGDHSCWWAVDKSGVRTNGGCRCLGPEIPSSLRYKLIHSLQTRIHEKTRLLELQISTMRKLLEKDLKDHEYKGPCDCPRCTEIRGAL